MEEQTKQVKNVVNKEQLSFRFDDFPYEIKPKSRVLSGIETLDYDLKGFEMGCITIWTGFTNAGKTTVMTMLAKETIKQGERIFFFNGEQTKEDFKNNLYIQLSDKKDLVDLYFQDNLGNDTCIKDTFVNEERARKLSKEYDKMIYIYNNEAKKKINKLLEAMQNMVKNEKIRVFFLDNFMQIETTNFNLLQEQTEIMEKLRTFAVNNKVHIHLVAHPRKTERFQVRLDLFDISGTSNLINKAYNIISIIRLDNLQDVSNSDVKYIQEKLFQEKYRVENVTTALEILKTKGNKCGFVGLTFDPKLKTYMESKRYLGEEYEQAKAQIKQSRQNKQKGYKNQINMSEEGGEM